LQTLEDRDKYEVLMLANNSKNVTQNITPFFPNLKWVQALGTGIENLLECSTLKSNDVLLTNIKSCSDIFLAEFALGGIVYFEKSFPYFLDCLSEKKLVTDYQSKLLSKRKILIVGAGSIGTTVAKRAKYGLDLFTVGVKRNVSDISHIKNDYDEIISMTDMMDRLHEFDFIVNSLPHIEGEPIFNELFWSKTKQNCVFISVGRGTVVDETSLYKHIKSGHVKGAALDVLQNEPITLQNHIYDPELKGKVIYTFHKMHESEDYDSILANLIKENVDLYLQGKPLKRVVDKKMGY
jgi:phosphoglycerate dehydrogenase-like enzyme